MHSIVVNKDYGKEVIFFANTVVSENDDLECPLPSGHGEALIIKVSSDRCHGFVIINALGNGWKQGIWPFASS